MSEKTILGRLNDELDDALRKGNDAEDRKREAEREVEARRAECGRFEDEARRLRLAIYALQGETSKTHGDVNTDNNARRRELRQERNRG